MNIKYDDDEEIEEPEVEAEVEKQSELKPEMTSQKRQKTKSETEYVYVAEDDTEEEDEEESSEATEDVSQTGGYTHETPMHTSKNSDSNMSDSGISINIDLATWPIRLLIFEITWLILFVQRELISTYSRFKKVNSNFSISNFCILKIMKSRN